MRYQISKDHKDHVSTRNDEVKQILSYSVDGTVYIWDPAFNLGGYTLRSETARSYENAL